METEVGAIILATGYNLYDLENIPECSGGKIPDVIDALALEAMLFCHKDPEGCGGNESQACKLNL